MEKKKSKLVFVPSHHDFNLDGIEYTEEMDSWPILNSRKERVRPEIEKLYKDAFKGLSQLNYFWMKISMMVDIENKYFRFPHRTWGIVYLNERAICQFSHDSRVDNSAFHSLYRWPELISFPSDPEYLGEDKEDDKVDNWSSPDNWTELIVNRIKKTSKAHFDKAEELEKEHHKEYLIYAELAAYLGK